MAAGKWGKILADGQQLLIPEPPGQKAAAVIDVLSVSEGSSAASDNEVVLSGTVSRLSLERKTGQLFAAILIGDLPFTVGLPLEQGRADNIFPGQKINLHYRYDQIKWI